MHCWCLCLHFGRFGATFNFVVADVDPFLMNCWYLFRSRTQPAKLSKVIVLTMDLHVFTHQQKLIFDHFHYFSLPEFGSQNRPFRHIDRLKIDCSFPRRRTGGVLVPTFSEHFLLFFLLFLFWCTFGALASIWAVLGYFQFRSGRCWSIFDDLLIPLPFAHATCWTFKTHCFNNELTCFYTSTKIDFW